MNPAHQGAPIAAALSSFEAEDYLLLAAVVLLPWAFGGVELWALRLASLLVASSAAVVLVRRGLAGLGLDRKALWLLPAALLALWGALQVVPLPSSMIRLLSPGADAIYREVFPAYAAPASGELTLQLQEEALRRVPEADGLPGPARNDELFFGATAGQWRGNRTLSLKPSAGVELVHWYVILLLAFLLVRVRTADPELAHNYRNVMFLLFASLAVIGLLYTATGNGKLLWFRETLDATRPFGPYVNPTNFAVVMELGVPWILGHALMQLRRSGGGALAVLAQPIFFSGALVCLAAGLLASSKFAAVLLIAAVTVLLLLFARRAWVRWSVAAAALVGWSGVGFLMRGTELGQRMRELLDVTGGSIGELGRLTAWKAALPMVGDFLVAGTGFGAFGDVFQRYVPSGAVKRWQELHNDYLELLIEGGLIAAILVAWLAFAFWRRVLWPPGRPGRGGLDLERAGLLLGLVSMSVHAVVDFNHQIPSDGLLFVALAGIAIAAAETRGGSPE